MTQTMYILHLLGMAMGVGTGFVMIALNIATKDMESAEKSRFMQRASAASVVSSVGLILLIATGIFMAIPLWSSIGEIWTFHVKLGLVLLMVAVFGLFHMNRGKAKRTGEPKYMQRAGRFSQVLTVLGVLVVVFAALSFH